MTVAKGITNGCVPMGAVFAKRAIHDVFMQGPEHVVEFPHGYTYSAHPLACAAALATLETYADEGLLTRGAKMAPSFEHAVHSLDESPHVIDVRNIGLVGAIELESIPGAPGKRAFESSDLLRARRADPHHRRHPRALAAADRRRRAHRPGDQHHRRRPQDRRLIGARVAAASLRPSPSPHARAGAGYRTIAGLPAPRARGSARAMSASAFLQIRNVVKTFDGHPRRGRRHRIDIAKGEVFALLGSSGCGKTTLLRMLAGFETPTSGSITLDGRDLAGLPPYERPMNMMFQSYALFPHLTVFDNIAFGLRRDGLPGAEIAARVESMLKLVQLGRLCEAQAASAFGRAAAARGARAQPGQEAAAAAARRAARRARPQAARRDADRARQHHPRGRRDLRAWSRTTRKRR